MSFFDKLKMGLTRLMAGRHGADELSLAMEARCYRGGKNRTAKKAKGMTGSSWMALLICAVICAAEAIL